MFQGSLPHFFWPFSILAATHLINKLSSVVRQWKTPHFSLYGKDPDYSLIKPFGCLAFAANTNPHKTKFSSRSSKCIILGCASLQKGYTLYEIETGKIFVSRDVRVFEDIFPFKFLIPPPEYTCLPLIPLEDPIPSTRTTIDLHSSSSCDTTTASTPVAPHRENIDLDQPLGRGCRNKSKPGWLNDFITNNVLCSYDASTSSDLLVHSPSNFSPTYVSYLANVSAIHEPTSFKQAVQHNNWNDAMDKELTVLEHKPTWVVIDLPPNKRAIGCKWVIKLNSKLMALSSDTRLV